MECISNKCSSHVVHVKIQPYAVNQCFCITKMTNIVFYTIIASLKFVRKL